MRGFLKQKSSSVPEQGNRDLVIDLINKMQRQLDSMERKIDSILDRPQKKFFRDKGYSDKDKYFSRPFEHHGRSRDRGKRKRDGGFGGNKNFTKAVCATCGSPCEVPFKPSEGRPVYCDECFSKQKGGGRRF